MTASHCVVNMDDTVNKPDLFTIVVGESVEITVRFNIASDRVDRKDNSGCTKIKTKDLSHTMVTNTNISIVFL